MAEEKKSTYATDVKKLYMGLYANRAFWKESSDEEAKEVMCMIYNGEVVFNRAFFELICETSLELASIGTRELPLYYALGVVSRKTDYDGTVTEADFSGAEYAIEPNETDSVRSGEYTIVQKYSNLSISGTWTQKVKALSRIEFSHVESVSVRYDDIISASGSNTVYPRVSVTYVVKYVYDNGTSENKTLSTNGYVTYAYGVPQNSSGATIDSSGGVSADSLYDDEWTYDHDVFTVSSMSGYVQVSTSGGTATASWSWSGTVNVQQASNTLKEGTWSYDISSSLDIDNVTAASQTVYIRVSAWRNRTNTWSSGYEEPETAKATVYISAPSSCSASSSYVSGDAEVTIGVPANTTTLSRSFTVNVYNTTAGYDKDHVIFQSADEIISYKITDAKIVGAQYMQAPAEGGLIDLAVSYSGTRTPVWASGKDASGTAWTGTTTTFSSLTGKALVSGATFDFSTGQVYAPSLGTTPTDEPRNVAQVTYIAISTDAGTLTWSGTVYAQQMENTWDSTEYSDYALSLSAGSTTAAASGQTIRINATATYVMTKIYTSGGREPITTASSAKLTTSAGTFSGYGSSATVSSGSSVNLITGENKSSSSRTITVSAVHTDKSSLTKTLTITQAGASFELYEENDKTEKNVSASGDTVTFSVISLRNDKVLTLDKSNVTQTGSGIKGWTFGLGDTDAHVLEAVVDSNSSSSGRYMTFSVVQPGNESNPLVLTIAQAASSSGGGGSGGGTDTSDISVEIEASYASNYEVEYFVTFSTSSDILSPVEFRVTDSSYGEGYTFGSYTDEGVPFRDGDSLQGTVTLSESLESCYLSVWIDGEMIDWATVK